MVWTLQEFGTQLCRGRCPFEKKNQPPIPLAKVDATVETQLGSRFGVTGYPSLKVFRKGAASEYKGPRDTNGIVSYMKKQEGASAKPLKSATEVQAFLKNKDVSVIGAFSSESGSSYDNFKKTSDALREEYRFGLVTQKSVMDEMGLHEGVTLFGSFGEPKTQYTGSHNVQDLTNWIHDHAVPKVGEFTKDNRPRYQKKNLPVLKVYIDIDYNSNLKRTNYYLNRLKKVAEDANLASKLNFAIVHKEDFKDEMDKFGVKDKDAAFVIDDAKDSLKYQTNAEFSVEAVKKFAQDFVSGKLKPYIKSEPIPANDQPLKTVVGENFNQIVMDPTKDVLIELYAPWCGHCKKLAPAYEELANSLKDVENIVIAKMDATANDSPQAKYQAKGFPTILFAPAGKKDSPITYSGERDVKSFTEWLKKNASSWKTKDTKSEL